MKEYGTVSGAVIDNSEYEQYQQSLVIPEKDPSERSYVEPEAEPIPEHDPIAYARETIDTSVAGSDYFINLAHEKGIDPSNTSSTEYLRLLYDVTNEYLDQEANKAFFMEIDGGETYHAIRLFGIAPYAIRQEITLDNADASGHKDGVSHAKSAVVALNHALFDLAEANPKRKLTELAEQVELATTIYDHTAKGYAYNVLMQSSYGVRTEYGFWQASNYRPSPNYSFRRGSAEEDKKGIDFVAGIADDIELKIDIKSSLQQVKEKAGQHEPTESEPYTKTDDGQFVYCPQISEGNFMKGTFELDTAEKIKLRNKILEDLQKMAKL